VFYYNYQKPNLELLLRGQGVYARLRFPMYTLLMNTVENCYVWMRIVETRIVCITSFTPTSLSGHLRASLSPHQTHLHESGSRRVLGRFSRSGEVYPSLVVAVQFGQRRCLSRACCVYLHLPLPPFPFPFPFPLGEPLDVMMRPYDVAW